jgi:hypothetical protein
MNYEHFITEKDILQKFPQLNEKEAHSLHLYKGSYYEVINHYLRTGIFVKTEKITSEDELKTIIADIKRAMKPFGRATKVYRGMPYSLQRLEEPGAVIYDLAFMSTTMAEAKTYKFTKSQECCVFEIRCDEAIQCIQFQDSEREVLLQNGLKLVDFIFVGRIDTAEGPKMFFKCRAQRTTPDERTSVLKEAQAIEIKNREYQQLYEERVRQMLLAEDFDIDLEDS